jgi:hypothetical protein
MNGVPAAQACGTLVPKYCTGELVASRCNPPYNWMTGQRLALTMIGAQQINAEAMLRHRLGGRYLRIDMSQSPEQAAHLGLDVATPEAAQTLAGLSEAALRDHLGQRDLTEILAHPAPEPRFF